MGGWTMPNTMDYSLTDPVPFQDTFDFDAGWALGATLGIETPIDGFSVEVDVLLMVTVTPVISTTSWLQSNW